MFCLFKMCRNICRIYFNEKLVTVNDWINKEIECGKSKV